jgi:hypothetical protein
MSLSHSPRIVTDGLVLCLDASDPQSYSGSGTTWTDRSGNGNHGTLVNGPTFNSDGYIELDGTNDRIASGAKLSGTEDGSIYLWCNPTSSNTNSLLVYQSSGVGRIWIYVGSTGVLALNTYFGSGKDFYLTASGSNIKDKWGLITVTFDRSGYQKIYYNGEFLTSRDISSASSNSWNSGTLALGGFDYNGPSWYTAQNKAAKFMVYNVEHTPEQILQNYNATKGRFGL